MYPVITPFRPASMPPAITGPTKGTFLTKDATIVHEVSQTWLTTPLVLKKASEAPEAVRYWPVSCRRDTRILRSNRARVVADRVR